MLLVKITIFIWAISLVLTLLVGGYVRSLEGEHLRDWLHRQYTKSEQSFMAFLGMMYFLDVIGFLYIIFWFLFLR